MTRQSATAATAAVVALGGPVFELRAGARRLEVQELGLTAGISAAGRFALTRSTKVGSGGTGMLGQPEDPGGPAAQGGLYAGPFGTLGATNPTFNDATYLRRVNTTASIGAGAVWTWPITSPLIIPAGTSLVVVALLGAPSIVDAWATWTE